MVAIRFEDLLEAVKALDAPQKAVVLRVLHQAPAPSSRVTREELIAEHEARRAAGAFEHVESLFNKYDNGRDITYEEIEAAIHEASTEWEKELDEFHGKPD
jgi:hypothetical protein